MSRYGFKGASKSRCIVRMTIFSAITAAYGRLSTNRNIRNTWNFVGKTIRNNVKK
jgi:hypothetical protein